MEIETIKKDNTCIVSVKGRMDALSSPEFEKKIDELIEAGENFFIVDFEKVDYISSAGLRAILSSSKKLKKQEGHLLISSLKDNVKKVFDIAGFSSILPIYETVNAALENI